MDSKLYREATSGSTNLFFEIKDSNVFLQETREKNSALHLAVRFNRIQFAEKIINLHPRLLVQANSKGDTPLHIAARAGCLEITKILIDCWNARSPEVEADQKLLRMVNLEKDMALHDAVRNGEFEIVKLLIKEDKDLALFINDNGESPLFLAVDRKFFDIASHILKAAPGCSYHGRGNMNVLHAAIIRHHVNILLGIWSWYIDNPFYFIKQLLSPIKFAYIRLKEKLDDLRLSSEADFMREFIRQHPIAIKEADDLGWTPLHYAAYLCHKKAIELILNINDSQITYMKDKEGMSALHIAAKGGHETLMRQLITFSPETCELLDYKGRTALHVAVENGKASVVKYVLKTPDLEGLINEQDKDGNTPLHLAAVHGHNNIVNMLADDRRVDKGAMNKEGFTALEIILSRRELRRFQTAWTTTKLERAGGPPSLKGMVKFLNVEEPDENPEIKSTTLDKKGDQPENKDSKFDRLKMVANTHLLVATIIATVTFAAGFTMPGGYESQDGPDKGTAILSRKSAFQAFFIADTVTFCFSVASMFIHFWASMNTNYNVLLYFIRFASLFTYYAIIGMVIAFISGTNAVLVGSSGLATTELAVGCCFFVIIFSIWFFR